MKWHSFRRRKLKSVVPFIYYFLPYTKEVIGEDVWLAHILEGEYQHELIAQDVYDKACDFLIKKIIDDTDYSGILVQESRRAGVEMISFCKSNLTNLAGLSNEEIYEKIADFYDYYQKFSAINMPPWIFAADKLSKMIIDELEATGVEDSTEIYIILSTPEEPSYLKKEELACLDAAIKSIESSTPFEKLPEFMEIQKKYFWVPFDYYGPEIWDEKYYKSKIGELVCRGVDELRSEMDLIAKSQSDIRATQLDLAAKYKIDMVLVQAIRDIATLQDEKKAFTTEAHYDLQQLYKEVAKRTNLDLTEVYFLTNEEVEQALGGKDLKGLIRDRQELSVCIVKDGKVSILAMQQAMDYAKEHGLELLSEEVTTGVKEVKGVAGSPGKVQGIARVIAKKEDFGKLHEGEILIAPMTTPDYVTIMKLASAFVTDEGGVTCHASIVAREMNKPCIIGTKIATKVFKDGDMVEVDAGRGVVRRIDEKD